MEITDDFYLDYGQKLLLRKPSGHFVVEFSRHPDKDLDNIIEVWSYDSRKNSKGKSSWIIQKDLVGIIRSKMTKYPEALLEAKTKKENKD